MKNKQLFTLGAMVLCVLATTWVHASPSVEENQRVLAPTYTIFATREGLVGQQTANGHIIQPHDHFVSLPSWRSLSPSGTNTYKVRVTYKGRSVVLPVWDVGPWNTHDDYWSPDRERYRDLPVGVPMAQAAYLDGYNGGLDEFGRRTLHPNGVDIADGAFWDDLGMTANDWVQLSFLWLGDDPGPNATPDTPAAAPDMSLPDKGSETGMPPGRVAEEPTASPEPTATPEPTPDPVQLDNPVIEPGAFDIDNNDAGYRASGTLETAPCGVNSDHAWTFSATGGGDKLATWSPKLATAGTYEVKAYIPGCGEESLTSAAYYTVAHDDGETEVTVNQAKTAGTWVSLGSYSFQKRHDPTVLLSDRAGDNGKVVRFDTLAWILVEDTTAPSAKVTDILREDNGFRVEWGGSGDLSSIASYDVQVRQLPNGAWRFWMKETTKTDGWFGPDEGKEFAFRARARDLAGNEQPWVGDEADMDTIALP